MMHQRQLKLLSVVSALLCNVNIVAFVVPSTRKSTLTSGASISQQHSASCYGRNDRVTHFMSVSSTQSTQNCEILSLKLEKPLGLILEENEVDGGVVVVEVNDGGSAYVSPYASRLIRSKVKSVMGKDVTSLGFDDVLSEIGEASTPVDIEFILSSVSSNEDDKRDKSDEKEFSGYEIGTSVMVIVQQPEKNTADIVLTAKVGENLRKTLLNNKDIELYRGLKKKLGNCGGVGQCGFCAVELIDQEGVWGERSEYEDVKIGKNGSKNCRLACMNNIAGPATIRTL